MISEEELTLKMKEHQSDVMSCFRDDVFTPEWPNELFLPDSPSLLEAKDRASQIALNYGLDKYLGAVDNKRKRACERDDDETSSDSDQSYEDHGDPFDYNEDDIRKFTKALPYCHPFTMYLKIPPVDAVCGTKYGFCPMSDSLSGWHKKYMISGFVPLNDKKSKRGCRGGFSVTGLPAHLEGCNSNRFFHDIAYKYLMNLKSQAFFIAPFAEEELVTNRIRPDMTSLLSGKSLTASTYKPTQHQADKRLTIAVNKSNLSLNTSLNKRKVVPDHSRHSKIGSIHNSPPNEDESMSPLPTSSNLERNLPLDSQPVISL